MTPNPHPAEAQPASAWLGFVHRHLFDYPAPARAAWLAITGTGAAALGWALWHIAALPGSAMVPLALALGMVTLAAALALKLPRTAYSLSITDVFVFGALVALGPAAAVLAAGIDGMVGTLRNSRRLSSRISTPAAAMAAMAACGWAFEQTKAALALLPLGLGAQLVPMAALLLVALLPFVLTTMPLMAMMALKRREPMAPRQWLADSAWMAAVYLASALIAGLLYLNAQRFGQALLLISGLSALAILLTLRVALLRQDAERRRQEGEVADAKREADLNQKRFSAAFGHAAIGMVIVKPDGRILQANGAFCELLRFDPGSLVDQPFETLLDGADAHLLRRRASAALASADDAFSMAMQIARSTGDEIWVEVHCSQYEDPSGSGQCLIYQLHDITARRVAERRLNHQAHHDGLTDLANRQSFRERLAAAVEQTQQDTRRCFAVLYLDLDRFKLVNDTLGHTAGNEVLREVALRLRACARPGDLVARLGGDEFALLVEALDDVQTGLHLADRVLDELARPMCIAGTELVPGASVGITFGDLGCRAVDEILRDADLAMYEAKAEGGGRVVRFDQSMRERIDDRLALETDLRRAIGDGELSVHFQPIYQLEPYRLSGFEALARWVHPQRGPVSPAVFIAMAEESGHIEALTDWIIDAAMAQLARWKQTLPDARHLGMHVNISGRDLARISLVSRVRQVLQRHQAAPYSLTLEITETTLMGRLDVALRTMAQLHAANVRFSIDDFGTGFSSLAYLSSLPIDSLKIDRSFVTALHERPQNVEIVRAIVMLAQALQLKVIAEGVETVDQLDSLRRLGVQEGQGYLLSRPMRAEQVPALFAADVAQPA